MEKIVVASGYFNPLHSGHIEYLERSKALGTKLIVIVNTDKQSIAKKGESFLNQNERLKIIKSLRCVDFALLAIDTDRSVCETLKILQPDIFTNGGDVFKEKTLEYNLCKELGIEMVDGLGEKKTSSTSILNNYINSI